jgi:hypothetical protein
VRRYLVVGNQTLASDRLAEKVQDVLAAGPAEICLVVPATPTHHHLTWTEGAAHEVAERNLEGAIAAFSELGAEVRGEVGDANPIEAVRAALVGQLFDEIIVSTLPLGLSRWVKQDLPHRVSREFRLPVSHVVGESVPTVPPAPPRAGPSAGNLRTSKERGKTMSGGDQEAPKFSVMIEEKVHAWNKKTISVPEIRSLGGLPGDCPVLEMEMAGGEDYGPITERVLKEDEVHELVPLEWGKPHAKHITFKRG